jgi:hypothetical protein
MIATCVFGAGAGAGAGAGIGTIFILGHFL